MKEYLERSKLTEKRSAIRVVLNKATGEKEFGDVTVYVKTSDKSGEIYVKYNLVYEKDSVGETCKDKERNMVPLTWHNGANGGYNRSNYRIKTAQICRLKDGGCEKLFGILQQGEISMAVKEIRKADGARAGDFVGGYHGDENIKLDNGAPMVKLVLDGNSLPLDGSKEQVLVGDRLVFEQTTIIGRCNTPGVDLMEHFQRFTFDTSGFHVDRRVKILTSDYEDEGEYMLDHGGTYLQMCTFWRLKHKENYVRTCDFLKFFDKDGNPVNEADTSNYNEGDFGFAGEDTEKINTTVEYNGKSGIYGLVGFKVVDDSVDCHSAKIMIRTFGDNKWYCTFKSKNPSGQPKRGEEWKLDLLYYIDYNSER